MRKILTAFVAAASLAVAAAATSGPAEAWGRGGWGWGWGLGGFAAGAIVGSALAAPPIRPHRHASGGAFGTDMAGFGPASKANTVFAC
jgi:hypothetical protein